MPAEQILFLPGMMCDARLWAPQIEALGIPAQVADTTTADNIADIARAVLAAAPERFALAGLSMGGIVAFEIWRQARERVTHLALLDTNPHAEAPDRKTMRLQQMAAVFDGKLAELAIESMKPLYLARANRNDQRLLGTLLQMVLDLGPAVFARQSLALKDRVDSVPTLATIDCPTTVICGREDILCPVAHHELMAKGIDAARLVVLEDCGHISTLEQPDAVTAELQRLIET